MTRRGATSESLPEGYRGAKFFAALTTALPPHPRPLLQGEREVGRIALSRPCPHHVILSAATDLGPEETSPIPGVFPTPRFLAALGMTVRVSVETEQGPSSDPLDSEAVGRRGGGIGIA